MIIWNPILIAIQICEHKSSNCVSVSHIEIGRDIPSDLENIDIYYFTLALRMY